MTFGLGFDYKWYKDNQIFNHNIKSLKPLKMFKDVLFDI